MDFFKIILLEWLDRCELGWVSEDAPYRFARRHDGAGQRRVGVLQQRENFLQQHLVRSPQCGKRSGEAPGVIRAKLIEQVVDLILQRDLGEDTDGVSLLESGLQRFHVQR